MPNIATNKKSSFRKLLGFIDEKAKAEIGDYYLVGFQQMDNFIRCMEGLADRVNELEQELKAKKQTLEKYEWIRLTDRMPNPTIHKRVLIYTEGHDFNGQQIFDVEAEALNECFFNPQEDQPEVCRLATHWAAYPSPTKGD